MKRRVIDENVPMVANEASKSSELRIVPQADEKCILNAVEFIDSIVKSGAIVIDTDGRVVAAYRKKLSGKGMPGVGDMFLKHIVDHQYDDQKITLVSLEVAEDGEFSLFPKTDKLDKFDKMDRVLVALQQSVKKSRIVNCVDSDYQIHAAALAEQGVLVDELCPHCLKQT